MSALCSPVFILFVVFRFGPTWQYSGPIPDSAFKDHSWQSSGDHVECRGLNLDLLGIELGSTRDWTWIYHMQDLFQSLYSSLFLFFNKTSVELGYLIYFLFISLACKIMRLWFGEIGNASLPYFTLSIITLLSVLLSVKLWMYQSKRRGFWGVWVNAYPQPQVRHTCFSIQ